MAAELRRLPLDATVALALVVGLMVGSFVNVVVYRAPRRLSISRPRSFCPNCGTPLRSIDNVPLLSWLALGGRCRTCRTPISTRYPLIEGIVGATFAGLALAVGSRWAVPGLCALAAGIVAMAAIELDDAGAAVSVAIVSALLGAALLVGAAIAGRLWAHLAGAGVGLAVALLFAALAGRPFATGTTRWDSLPILLFLGWTGPVAGPVALGAWALFALALRRRMLVVVPGVAACVVAVVVAVSTGTHLGT